MKGVLLKMYKKIKKILLFLITVITTAIFTLLIHRSLHVYPELKGTYGYNETSPGRILHYFIDGQFSQIIGNQNEEIIRPYEKVSDNIYLINRQYYLILNLDNSYNFVLNKDEIATFQYRDTAKGFSPVIEQKKTTP